MLRELTINNLAIIEQVNIEFGEGLTVLTGETGAGKSMMLAALELLMGKNGQTHWIRNGKESLTVEGVFDLSPEAFIRAQEMFALEERELIIRREISNQRSNRLFINGKRATTTVLKEFFEEWIEVIGQQGNQVLFQEKNHLCFVDEFLENPALLKQYKESYQQWQKLRQACEKEEKERESQREKYALFQFQHAELSPILPWLKEERELEEKYRLYSHAEEIEQELNHIEELLASSGQGVLAQIKKVSKLVDKLATLHPVLEKKSDQIESLWLDLSEIDEEFKEFKSSLEVDPEQLSMLSEQLDTLHKMKLKYCLEREELLAYYQEIEAFLEQFTQFNESATSLQEQLKVQEERVNESANLLSKARQLAGEQLKIKLCEALEELGMPHTQVEIGWHSEPLSLQGRERAQFLISTNRGESLKPMSEILSGGEGSRVILALKTLFSMQKGAEILILDEIDMGVGGKTIEKMAATISKLPQRQVICITHSAVVAAVAPHHYYLEKYEESGSTYVTVEALKGKRRVEEIARMLAGTQLTPEVLFHAEKLLEG